MERQVYNNNHAAEVIIVEEIWGQTFGQKSDFMCQTLNSHVPQTSKSTLVNLS